LERIMFVEPFYIIYGGERRVKSHRSGLGFPLPWYHTGVQ